MINLGLSLVGQLLGSVTPAGLLGPGSTAWVWYDPSDVANTNWRRNLLTWTEQFDNAAWSKQQVTVSANLAVAPDGTTTADALLDTAVSNIHYSGQSISALSLSGRTCTVSAYLKASTLGFATLGVSDVSSGSLYAVAVFNLSNGTLSTSGAVGAGYSVSSTSVTAVGNGWYRCSVTAVVGTSAAFLTAVIGTNKTGIITTAAGGFESYLGNGSGILIWGAQLEVGSVATEYQRITDVNTEVIQRFPTATLYQDAAGTTPVTAPAQPVGLVLDKSQGLVLGPELVTNGDFSSGTTGWSAGNSSTISVTSGVAQVAQTSSNLADIRQTITTVAGRTYRVSCEIASQNAASIVAVAQDTSTFAVIQQSVAVTSATVTTVSFVFTANAATTRIAVRFNASGASGNTFTTDNISVRELTGFHATQSTAASRPTYGVVPSRGRVNLATPSTLPASASGMWQSPNNGTAVVGASGPFGTATAATLTANGGTEVRWRGAFTHLVNTQYTWSAYVKRGTARYAYMRPIALGGSSTQDGAWFDITNGVVGSRGVNVSATSIQAAGDGWFRITMTATTPSSITNQLFDVGLTNGDAVVTSTNGETMLFDAVQIELGSTATTYQRVVSQFDVTDPVGFPSYPLHYLSFDGVDDFLVTPTITPNADKVQVFAGVRKLSDAALAIVAELSNATGSGYFSLAAPAGASATYRFASMGTVFANAVSASSFAAPITNVLTGLGDISGDLATLRVNGTQAAQSTADQGTGNFLAYPLFIGRRGGTSNPFNGQLFQLITRFSTTNLDAGLVSQTERFVGQKTGVTI